MMWFFLIMGVFGGFMIFLVFLFDIVFFYECGEILMVVGYVIGFVVLFVVVLFGGFVIICYFVGV